MKKSFWFAVLIIFIFIATYAFQNDEKGESSTSKFVVHEVDPIQSTLQFFHKDENGSAFQNHGNLKSWLKDRDTKLLFAMNGGMYQENLTPLGLYVEKGKVIKQTNRVKEAHGNFYLQPNGIFYLKKDKTPAVVKTTDFVLEDNIEFATQSGPMLLIDGEIHPSLNKGSSNLHIRNGVGILPDGKVLFAMSKEKVNFYDFASLFLEHGCKNALYLDGFVSKTYAPEENWEQLNGKFGIILAEVE